MNSALPTDVLFRSLEEKLDTQRITQSFQPGKGPDQQLTPGVTLVNRYLIQEVIGLGGMGSVYRARDLHFPNVVKLVAVKEMINQARDPLVRQTIVQNFEREANILVTLNHPAIPRIFDYFTHEERSYLVLEYVNGKDLEAYLSEVQGFLPEDVVIGWAIELCDVLFFLHNHKPEPIIFRDVKPSNIMINQSNHVILVDFGIAKVFRAGQKGTMIGTEGYSPPEQYRGEATPQADVYALGATMHHLLTRKDPRLEPPFTFGERPLRSINPGVSPELELVVNTALQYDPKDRYQDMMAMKEALVNVARKTGALMRMAYATAPISEATGTVKPIWTFECEDEIRGTPTVDGNLVFVGAYDNNLYAVDNGTGKFVWKYPTDGGVVTKPVVMDNLVYFGSEDRRLHAVTTRTGKIYWTYFTDGPVRSSPAAAEGHIFFGSDDGHLHAVNMLSARRAWLIDAAAPVRSTPFVTQEHVYFGNEDGDFFCANFQGIVKWRFKAKRPITSSPLVSQGVVFFGSLDSFFYALDAKSGWVIWRFRMAKGSISSAVRADNLVFFGSADTHLYCVDAGNAREIWRFKTDHQVNSAPVIHKDSIYVTSVDGHIYCLEYKTGRLRWKYKTGGPITGAPLVYNDVVYVGSTDHILYALLA